MVITDYARFRQLLNNRIAWRYSRGWIKVWDRDNVGEWFEELENEATACYLELREMPEDDALDNAIQRAQSNLRPRRPVDDNGHQRYTREWPSLTLPVLAKSNIDEVDIRISIEQVLTADELQAHRLKQSGYTQREIGKIMGLRHQRVSELLRNARNKISHLLYDNSGQMLHFKAVYSEGKINRFYRMNLYFLCRNHPNLNYASFAGELGREIKPWGVSGETHFKLSLSKPEWYGECQIRGRGVRPCARFYFERVTTNGICCKV